jgi:MFS family permease
MTLAVITYIDRVCISQAAGDIQRDLGLTKVQMGWAFAAFAWAYALFEIPGGWLGDKIGPRKVLTRVVLWWSFFTAATGWAWNLVSLLLTRFLFGAGEAGCFPNLAKMFTNWLPQKERSRAVGIMWLSARWGGAFTPVLVVWVFSLVSWRRAFEAFGVLGILWAIWFFSWFRDNPRDHKKVNAAELALLHDTRHNSQGHANVPWKKLLRSRTVWMLWLQYFCFSWGWYFYITWLPTYLKEARGLEIKDNILLSWVPALLGNSLRPEIVQAMQVAVLAGFPLFFGGVGSLIGGVVANRLARFVGDMGRARRAIAYFGFLSASGLLVLFIYLKDPVSAMLSMGLASFVLDLTLAGSWGGCMDVGGKYAGTLSGSMNMMGNLAGGLAPVAVGYILKFSGHNWSIVFWVSAAIYVLGALCWMGIDPVTPLERSETEAAPPEPAEIRASEL